ncbi:MAG: PEP-CTERM sorting domain-containing protein [Sedimentisphaerales bacterium]|nr:PEP-CTERM sorting domain-containing protein [Sedimentisphaerales bacterium]
MCKKLVFLAMLVAMASTAWAYPPIPYYDATPDNTYMAADYGPLEYEDIESADGIWRLRSGFGMAPTDTVLPATQTTQVDTSIAGTILESTGWADPPDDVPRLVTIVSGLDAGKEYDVYVCFWGDQSGSPWRIRAGLTNETELPLWVIGDGEWQGPTTPIQVGLDMSNRILYAALVGTVTGVEYIEMFVEDAPAANGNERTWYDGVALDVPEPATLVLLGLGSLALLRRKK